MFYSKNEGVGAMGDLTEDMEVIVTSVLSFCHAVVIAQKDVCDTENTQYRFKDEFIDVQPRTPISTVFYIYNHV